MRPNRKNPRDLQYLLTGLLALFKVKSVGYGFSVRPTGLVPRVSIKTTAFLPVLERPHECQIGSGEETRNAVRTTFESRQLGPPNFPA
jgi:hypothetical protein